MRGGGAVDEERRDRGATNDWLWESRSHRKTTKTTTTTATTGTNVSLKIQESHTEGGM